MKNINIEVISKSPGKCLICGGYLILNKNKKGVVINSDTYIVKEAKSYFNLSNSDVKKYFGDVK